MELTNPITFPFDCKAMIAATAVSLFTTTAVFALEPPVELDENGQPINVQLVADVGGSERIDASGKLRMLSQRIPAAACNYVAGIDPEGSKAILAGATAEFEKIVNALEFGDDTMNIIGAEERRKTLRGLQKLREVWAPIKQSADAIVSSGADKEHLTVLKTQNMELLKITKLLVSEISGEYSNPAEILQSDAMLVDIAGRQRMLTQKISKEACAVWSNHDAETAFEDMTATIAMYDTSLNALREGFPDAGIVAPPTEEIKADLIALTADWNKVKEDLANITPGSDVSPDLKMATFQELNALLANSNAIVGLYTVFSKRKY